MSDMDMTQLIGPLKFTHRAGYANPVAVCGEVAFVLLTRGYYAILDTDDLQKIAGQRWHAQTHDSGRLVYAISGNPYLVMHRRIIGAKPGLVVDHKNGNGLDNRAVNLREATHAQNMANRRPRRGGKSPFLGVCFDPGKDRNGVYSSQKFWRAKLRKGGHVYRGVRRACHYQAALDYDNLARLHHGDFARCNFP